MNISRGFFLLLSLGLSLIVYGDNNFGPPLWGFFGHKLINKMAVFTLPPEMIGFYKKNIEYITEHSVDPDKRRYSNKLEAPRHYMDMENYGTYPFENLPRTWNGFLGTYAEVFVITDDHDTIKIMGNGIWRLSSNEYKVIDDSLLTFLGVDDFIVSKRVMNNFITSTLNDAYFNDYWHLPVDSIKILFKGNNSINKVKVAYGNNSFAVHGILPYNLEQSYSRLVKAFVLKDADKILRYSAEIGHYLADAHVPLHTSKNYNGQLSDQDGIHAFWESRIPELFANQEFDFLVGKANRIDNTNSFFWKIIFDSHEGVQSLLDHELELKTSFSKDKQFCYENRALQVVRTQCREFAEAYNNSLDGQVEERMRASIISIGSIWYSAWLEGGQPDLNSLSGIIVSDEDKKYFEQLESDYQKGNSGFGRNHE